MSLEEKLTRTLLGQMGSPNFSCNLDHVICTKHVGTMFKFRMCSYAHIVWDCALSEVWDLTKRAEYLFNF